MSALRLFRPPFSVQTPLRSATWMRRVLLVALACYLGGRLGLAIPRLDAQASLIWPPSGIALAALLRWGLGMWPAVGAGALYVRAVLRMMR